MYVDKQNHMTKIVNRTLDVVSHKHMQTDLVKHKVNQFYVYPYKLKCEIQKNFSFRSSARFVQGQSMALAKFSQPYFSKFYMYFSLPFYFWRIFEKRSLWFYTKVSLMVLSVVLYEGQPVVLI